MVIYSGRPAMEADPATAATVARATEDLRSNDAGVRAAAAMLLGKYHQPVARLALAGALNDASTIVRRAAVVSLLERQGQVIVPDPAGDRLLQLLVDPDVEIRRHVSSALPFLASTTLRFIIAGQTSPPAPGGSKLDLSALLSSAWDDPDAVVRRNVLAYFPYQPFPREPEDFHRRLDDPDREVRWRALELAAEYLPADLLIVAIEKRLPNAEPAFLRKAAQLLSTVEGGPVEALLKKWAEADDAELALTARLSLAERQPATFPDSPLWRDLVAGKIVGENAVKVARLLQRLPAEQTVEAVGQLFANPEAAVRAEAIRLWSRRPELAGANPPWDRLTQDESAAVRQALANGARLLGARFPAGAVLGLARSPHRELRDAALGLSRHQEAGLAGEILGEALADESANTRRQALIELFNRRLPGWEKALRAGLRDADPGVAQMAATIVVSTADPEGLERIKTILRQQPDSELSRYVRQTWPHLAAGP